MLLLGILKVFDHVLSNSLRFAIRADPITRRHFPLGQIPAELRVRAHK